MCRESISYMESRFFLLSFFCYHIFDIIFQEFDNEIRLLHPIAEGKNNCPKQYEKYKKYSRRV